MKLHLLSVLFLSLFLLYTPFSLAKRGGGGGGRKTSSTSYKPNKSSTSQGGYPKQNNQGSTGQQGNYPRQPGTGGNPYQHPGQRSPYGGYGGYGGQGGYGGGYGGHGGYHGTYINKNPNNKILSPHYGGSFGYGGYAAGGGSPFSNYAKAQGFVPSDNSKGFGRSAVKAAAGGAVAGMALGYGLGSFSRPHFEVRSPQEEYYYNHYMYRKHGSQSTNTNTNRNTNRNTNTDTNANRNTNTNTNDYSGGSAGDNVFTKPPQSYDNYMDDCMKRPDVLSAETQKPKNKTAAAATATTKTNTSTAVISESNVSGTEKSSTHTPSNPDPLNQLEDDDTVSIVEIGYPALVEQVKARRCLELYMVHYENYMRLTGGVRGLEMSFQGLLVTSTILVLLNSNMLMLLP
ncbi:prion protein b [Archocentrus centrarchus]|uniref:prion protein b n=1 Tax=Archocentrus centrarchus TaxID=63155 RepID=UPI0011EA09A3|nr:epsin-like [Archocentrus centrarchus]